MPMSEKGSAGIVKASFSLRIKDRMERLAAVLATLASLAACSGINVPQAAEEVPAPGSTFGSLIAPQLKTTFKTLTAADPIELSAPRWVHTIKGWTWLVCARFPLQGHRRVYVYLVKDDKIIDSRYAVIADGCDTASYAPIDPSSGAPKPPDSGEQSPLY